MLHLLKTAKLICTCLATALYFCGNSPAQEKREAVASDILLNGFGWMQTGRNLVQTQQWPLALGSYIEALQKYQTVARDFPEFEPEMVSYRLEALEDEITEIQKNLHSGDHDVMMAYLDFIDSMEKGQRLRFANNFEAALPSLRFAMSLLEEVIKNRPGEFRAAVDDQYSRLAESIEWVESQLTWKMRSLPMTAAVDDGNLGTTEFIKESDLPTDAMVSMSAQLFPGFPNFQDAPAVKDPVAMKKPKTDLSSRLPKSLGPGKPASTKKGNPAKEPD